MLCGIFWGKKKVWVVHLKVISKLDRRMARSLILRVEQVRRYGGNTLK